VERAQLHPFWTTNRRSSTSTTCSKRPCQHLDAEHDDHRAGLDRDLAVLRLPRLRALSRLKIPFAAGSAPSSSSPIWCPRRCCSSARRHHPQFPARRHAVALILTYPTFLIPFCTWLMIGLLQASRRNSRVRAHRRRPPRFKAMINIIFPMRCRASYRPGISPSPCRGRSSSTRSCSCRRPSRRRCRRVTSELIRGDVFFWVPLMAGALLGSIPVALVFIPSSSSITSPASRARSRAERPKKNSA